MFGGGSDFWTLLGNISKQRKLIHDTGLLFDNLYCLKQALYLCCIVIPSNSSNSLCTCLYIKKFQPQWISIWIFYVSYLFPDYLSTLLFPHLPLHLALPASLFLLPTLYHLCYNLLPLKSTSRVTSFPTATATPNKHI